MSISHLRREYSRATLTEADVDPDPIRQFEKWFDEARAAEVLEPNAMILATAAADGAPSARVMLLKGVDARGFVFFSNYESRKGRELAANPRAALVFFWKEIERQVRVTGAIERTSREESEAYFRSRPLGSRLGAWASAQSRVVPDRGALDARFHELAERYAEGDVPCPPYWGGFRLTPAEIEFWQGRASRLHDRLRYTRAAAGAWMRERLSP